MALMYLKDHLRAVASAFVAIAAALAVWAGTSWYAAANDDSADFARARDDVLAAGEQGVQNLNTLDYRQVDRGLDIWTDSSTGELLKQLSEGRAEFEKQVSAAKTVTTAKVLDGAVTELDERSGKARVMVAVRITVTAPKEKPATKDSRMLGELTKTDAGWKLSSLGPAPVGDSGESAEADAGTGAESGGTAGQ